MRTADIDKRLEIQQKEQEMARQKKVGDEKPPKKIENDLKQLRSNKENIEKQKRALENEELTDPLRQNKEKKTG